MYTEDAHTQLQIKITQPPFSHSRFTLTWSVKRGNGKTLNLLHDAFAASFRARKTFHAGQKHRKGVASFIHFFSIFPFTLRRTNSTLFLIETPCLMLTFSIFGADS